MKIVQYKQHSVVFKEAGVLFEHDFDKHINTYFTDGNETCLLNSLTAEKVVDFFRQDNFEHLALYENLYEINSAGDLIYLYDPTGKLLFLRKKDDLDCSEISSHSPIYSIFTEKLQKLLSNVTISVHLGKYNPTDKDFEEDF